MASTWTFTSRLYSSGGNTKQSYWAPGPGEHELLRMVFAVRFLLFGRDAFAYVHEKRTGPPLGFGDKNWSALHMICGTSVTYFFSGCSLIWCSLAPYVKGCHGMCGYVIATIIICSVDIFFQLFCRSQVELAAEWQGFVYESEKLAFWIMFTKMVCWWMHLCWAGHVFIKAYVELDHVFTKAYEG